VVETAQAIPTLADVRAARERIAPYLRPTPVYPYPMLGALVGADVWVKHENHQPVGAFKVRGGVNLVAQLTDDERRRGLASASTGNHGQSIAFGARAFGVEARIYVPEGANPIKVDAIRALGADVVFHGRDFDEAREECQRAAAAEGLRYVHSANEPHLIAGVATATLEVLEELPDVDVVVVPIGGGSGAAGACIVGKALRPGIDVIGVQSEAAPAAFRSWRDRRISEADNLTFAEGLATRVGFELTQSILWELLDDFVLVSDDELREAMVRMIEATRNLVEAAGAAPLAAARKLSERLAGKRVVLMCSGGNVSLPQLRDLLSQS
jgi:threonine dehydratase